MQAMIDELAKQAEESLGQVSSKETLASFWQEYLSKNGKIPALMKNLRSVAPEERPAMGKIINELKQKVQADYDAAAAKVKEAELAARNAAETVDITLPAKTRAVGGLHPLTLVTNQIIDVFSGMGFAVADAPEIEDDDHNFTRLNVPKNHPARDMQDSFYITPEILLRTHTSPVQVRTLRKHIPNSPIRMIAPGKVFRWDNDATHSPVFHQVEGLVVDKGIKFSDLKGTLEIFLKDLFGADTKIRFRASYFPFTEPSAEVDISFASRTHSESNDPDWLEILGCGMVHNMVLKLNGYNPNIVSGFAFGMGIERIAMLLYGIDDLRNFYENDIRFLEQF